MDGKIFIPYEGNVHRLFYFSPFLSGIFYVSCTLINTINCNIDDNKSWQKNIIYFPKSESKFLLYTITTTVRNDDAFEVNWDFTTQYL